MTAELLKALLSTKGKQSHEEKAFPARVDSVALAKKRIAKAHQQAEEERAQQAALDGQQGEGNTPAKQHSLGNTQQQQEQCENAHIHQAPSSPTLSSPSHKTSHKQPTNDESSCSDESAGLEGGRLQAACARADSLLLAKQRGVHEKPKRSRHGVRRPSTEMGRAAGAGKKSALRRLSQPGSAQELAAAEESTQSGDDATPSFLRPGKVFLDRFKSLRKSLELTFSGLIETHDEHYGSQPRHKSPRLKSPPKSPPYQQRRHQQHQQHTHSMSSSRSLSPGPGMARLSPQRSSPPGLSTLDGCPHISSKLQATSDRYSVGSVTHCTAPQHALGQPQPQQQQQQQQQQEQAGGSEHLSLGCDAGGGVEGEGTQHCSQADDQSQVAQQQQQQQQGQGVCESRSGQWAHYESNMLCQLEPLQAFAPYEGHCLAAQPKAGAGAQQQQHQWQAAHGGTRRPTAHPLQHPHQTPQNAPQQLPAQQPSAPAATSCDLSAADTVHSTTTQLSSPPSSSEGLPQGSSGCRRSRSNSYSVVDASRVDCMWPEAQSCSYGPLSPRLSLGPHTNGHPSPLSPRQPKPQAAPTPPLRSGLSATPPHPSSPSISSQVPPMHAAHSIPHAQHALSPRNHQHATASPGKQLLSGSSSVPQPSPRSGTVAHTQCAQQQQQQQQQHELSWARLGSPMLRHEHSVASAASSKLSTAAVMLDEQELELGARASVGDALSAGEGSQDEGELPGVVVA